MRRPGKINGEGRKGSYVYIVGNSSNQIVKVFSSPSISVDEIWYWHLSFYQRNSLGIFAFRNVDSVVNSIRKRFHGRIISEYNYKCSFEEMRTTLLMEQRYQRGFQLPIFTSLYILYQRVKAWFSSDREAKKYLHDNTFNGSSSKYFADIKVCSEGFIN